MKYFYKHKYLDQFTLTTKSLNHSFSIKPICFPTKKIMRKIIYRIAFLSFMLTLINCSKENKIEGEENLTDEQFLKTTIISKLTAFSAESGGELLTDEPLSERGICWGVIELPTIDNEIVSDPTMEGNTYSLKMIGLEPNKVYQTRAYAITKNGKTVYGKALSFRTKSVEQRAESNSYLVRPDDLIVIPVKRANSSRLGELISPTELFTADLIWMDNSNVIDSIFTDSIGASGSIIAITGKKEGNAVVAAKVNNKIVWSWHIWVTKDATNINTITMPSGTELMDRCIGATSTTAGDINAIGLHYQFGRKDPFPASVTFGTPKERELLDLQGNHPKMIIVDGPRDLQFAIENPLSFISLYNQDWCTQDYGDWWRTEGGQKSIYDPCPEGWKVAHLQDYAQLSDAHFNKEVEGGHMFVFQGQSNFWPYSGNRLTDGILENLPNVGTFWVNEVINSFAAFSPSFGNGGTAAVNGAHRSRGLSIRCVRE